MRAVFWSATLGISLSNAGPDVRAAVAALSPEIPPREQSQRAGQMLVERTRVRTQILCPAACQTYGTGVSPSTDQVCLDNDGECTGAANCNTACVQIFHDECVSQCSEWGSATVSTLNVCQDSTDKYKCFGEATCSTGRYRCKQPAILDCPIGCDGYGAAVSQDTSMVCQHRDPADVDYGYCDSLPCTGAHLATTHADYVNTAVCYQFHPNCVQVCAVGSASATGDTVCQDVATYTCTNSASCSEPNYIRCKPISSLAEVAAHLTRPLMRAETTLQQK